MDDIKKTEPLPDSKIRGVREEAAAAPPASFPSRREFLGRIAVTATAGAIGLAPNLASPAKAEAATTVPAGASDPRVIQSFQLRVAAATRNATVPVPPHTTNGDEQLYPDKSASYSKALVQDGYGRVNLNAYNSLVTALNSGNPSDFENIILGGTVKETNPQSGLCFDLEGSDVVQFGNAPSPANQENLVVVPPPPAVASAAYGTELVELYWASLLRDVAFAEYPTNSIAAQAAAELSSMPSYAGPRNSRGQVTPNILFRGCFPGETIGPYVSQLNIIPTSMGVQPISQQLTTYLPNIDYMTDLTTWFEVQSGISTGLQAQADPILRYLHNGRGFAALTYSDVGCQEVYTAFLVLLTLGAPLNPGNPYVSSRTQIGFGTFGVQDIYATIGEITARALDVVWYQKWYVHRRLRPEAGGGLVHLIETGQANTIDATLNGNVLNSRAVQASFNRYGTYLLSQAFPEGCPTHPSYPTGHGMIAGACITILKFFFDGSYVIPNPLMPTDDGLSLVPYTGSDAGQITVNGELNKLARNITFGHGILTGIHYRSDSQQSMILGEAFAISVLQDKAQTYNEKFTVRFIKLDGSIATISNQ